MVAFSGIIGFVGLMVPHIARMLVGGDYARVLPASALIGAVFLLCSDFGCVYRRNSKITFLKFQYFPESIFQVKKLRYSVSLICCSGVSGGGTNFDCSETENRVSYAAFLPLSDT